MISRTLRALLFCTALLIPAAVATAQTTATGFPELAARSILEPGDKVWIRFHYTADGLEREVDGNIVTITPSLVEIEADDLPRGQTDLAVDRARDRGRIEIPGDRVLSIRVYRKARRWGTLVGAGIGAGFGMVMAYGYEQNETDCGRCYALLGGIFGGIGMAGGWGIDLLRDSRPMVYSQAANAAVPAQAMRLTMSPQVSRQRHGVSFSIVW